MLTLMLTLESLPSSASASTSASASASCCELGFTRRNYTGSLISGIHITYGLSFRVFNKPSIFMVNMTTSEKGLAT